MRIAATFAVSITLALLAVGAPADKPALPPAPAPAAPAFPYEQAPEFRQFDFWIGDWDVTEHDQPAGRNTLSVREHGCVLLMDVFVVLCATKLGVRCVT